MKVKHIFSISILYSIFIFITSIMIEKYNILDDERKIVVIILGILSAIIFLSLIIGILYLICEDIMNKWIDNKISSSLKDNEEYLFNYYIDKNKK